MLDLSNYVGGNIHRNYETPWIANLNANIVSVFKNHNALASAYLLI